MLWGMPWSVFWGDPEDFIYNVKASILGSALTVKFYVQSGYDGYYTLYIDGIKQGAPAYFASGIQQSLSGAIAYSETKHVFSIVPQGAWSADIFDLSFQTDIWENGRVDRLKAKITAAPDQFAFGTGSAQFSSWALTGINRFINCAPSTNSSTWGTLNVTMTTNAGIHTVTLDVNGFGQASGTVNGDGSITFTALNGSGIGGTVALVYTGNIAAGVTVVNAFPASYPVYWKTSTFTAPDFPRAYNGIVYDDGHSSLFTYRSTSLVAGTYYEVSHQIDECGNESSNLDGGGTPITLVGAPPAAGPSSYLSGGATGPATTIAFAASSDNTSTYNIYDSLVSGFLSLLAANDSHAAGSGTINHTLAAISGTFTGTRYVLVRAVKGGIEEGNLQTLAMTYVNGVVQALAPPAPAVTNAPRRSGRTVTLAVSIDTNEQLVAPTQVCIFLYAWPGVPDYTTPTSTTNISASAKVGSNYNLDVSATAGADGVYGVAVRTKSAAGTQSANLDTYGPVRLRTALPAAPSTLVSAGY